MILRKRWLAKFVSESVLGAGAIRTKFAYEDCVDMRFTERVLREDKRDD